MFFILEGVRLRQPAQVKIDSEKSDGSPDAFHFSLLEPRFG
jgi:hypothetical protein